MDEPLLPNILEPEVLVITIIEERLDGDSGRGCSRVGDRVSQGIRRRRDGRYEGGGDRGGPDGRLPGQGVARQGGPPAW